MTVVPEWRRRGVARQLLSSCHITATCRLSERPHFLALLCYRGHEAAFKWVAGCPRAESDAPGPGTRAAPLTH
jgi:GNAT superfamily N-acetyltransferase